MHAFCIVIRRGDIRLSVCFIGVWLYAQLIAADMKSGREKKNGDGVRALRLRCHSSMSSRHAGSAPRLVR